MSDTRVCGIDYDYTFAMMPLELNTVIQGDCLDVLRGLPDACVDMVLCDPPYGVTAFEWDVKIPARKLIKALMRVLKPNGNIVLTSVQPYTSELVLAMPFAFKYTLVWEKNRPGGFVHAKNRPLSAHEDIVVGSRLVIAHKTLSEKRMRYNPQGIEESGLVYDGARSEDRACAVSEQTVPAQSLTRKDRDNGLRYSRIR